VVAGSIPVSHPIISKALQPILTSVSFSKSFLDISLYILNNFPFLPASLRFIVNCYLSLKAKALKPAFPTITTA